MGSSISGAEPLLENRDSSAFIFRLHSPGLAETGEKKEAGHREMGCGLRPLGGRGEAANERCHTVTAASPQPDKWRLAPGKHASQSRQEAEV